MAVSDLYLRCAGTALLSAEISVRRTIRTLMSISAGKSPGGCEISISSEASANRRPIIKLVGGYEIRPS